MTPERLTELRDNEYVAAQQWRDLKDEILDEIERLQRQLYQAFCSGFYWMQEVVPVDSDICSDIEERYLKPKFEAWIKGEGNPDPLPTSKFNDLNIERNKLRYLVEKAIPLLELYERHDDADTDGRSKSERQAQDWLTKAKEVVSED